MGSAAIGHAPVMVARHPVGHPGAVNQVKGGTQAQVALDRLRRQPDGDAAAGRMFTGKECGLCSDPARPVQRERL